MSQDRTGDGLGIDRQREDCHALIAQRGWDLVAEHVDNDKSAAAGKRRPGFDKLMESVARSDVDAVVSWSLDRLTRNRRDQLRLVETCEPRKTTIALVRGSDIDMSTPAGRMVADMLATMARHEIEVKSDRQRRAQEQAAGQGRRVGGRRPFGYEPDGVTVREPEAAAIREAYTSFLAGVPLGSIARDWNARGLLTGNQRRTPGREGEPARWTHDTVRRVLANGRNAGIRVYLHEEHGPAQWPALVSEATYRAARSLLEDPGRNAGGSGHAGRQLLTGVGICGHAGCGLQVHGGGASHHKPIYRCRSNRHVNRLAEPVDNYVQQVAIARLSRPDARDLLVDDTRPDVPALRNDAMAVRARLQTLSIQFADGDINGAQLRTGSERARSNLAALEAQIADAGRVDLLGPLIQAEDVRATWEALSLDRRRAVIATLMTVRVHSVGRGTRTFRPETISIEWKTEASP